MALTLPQCRFGTKLLWAIIFIPSAWWIISLRNFTNEKPTILQNKTKRLVGDNKLVLTSQKEADTYVRRREILRKACSTFNASHYKTVDSEGVLKSHLEYDEKNKLLFCAMEKVGCSFWKRVFTVISGRSGHKNPFDMPAASAGGQIHTVNKLGFDRIHQILQTSRKFIFVREPYSRLFSGYVDKIYSPNPGYFGFRRRVVEFARSAEAAAASGCAPAVTFAEFTKFVLYTIRKGAADGHFVPMFDHCRPCSIQYNIIGKMESFAKDAHYVINSHNLSSVVHLDFTSTDDDSIADVADLLFNRHNLKDCMSFADAIKFTWRKLKIRGIIGKSAELPTNILGNSTKKEDFIVAVREANRKYSPGKRKANRRDALVEALQSLDSDVLAEYREVFRPDFHLFGYDIESADLFPPNYKPSDFTFLDLN